LGERGDRKAVGEGVKGRCAANIIVRFTFDP
jgi:hypothetical protein